MYLSGLWTLLCILTLIAACGPHLVHHLFDRHSHPTHSSAHKSQPTDCRILTLLQYTPGAEGASALSAVVLPEVEGMECEPLFAMRITPRSPFHARSPPVISDTPLEIIGLRKPDIAGLRISVFVVGSFSYNSGLQMVPEFAGGLRPLPPLDRVIFASTNSA